MRSIDRFDSRLPQLLDELSQPRTPDWFDDFVGLTARTPQRPAWTLPERWLSMTEIARQPVLAPRLPLRFLAIGLLVILLAATTLLIVASQRHTPAPPFGLAQTGLVAFDRGGDIFVADPKTATERAIVTGPSYEIQPTWSLDGTRLAFERRENMTTHSGKLVVADADGSNAHVITPDSLIGISSYTFSPDGQQILLTTGEDRTSVAYVAKVDGSGIQQLTSDLIINQPTWRPPDGREIAFVGTRGFEDSGAEATGLYAMDIATRTVRTIKAPVAGRYHGTTSWSPDGTQLAFNEWRDAPALTVLTHVVGADGSGDRVLPIPDAAKWQWSASWSNDGRRLVGVRGYTGDYGDTRGTVVPADASGPGIEMTWPAGFNLDCCNGWAFAPDDSFILGLPTTASGRPAQQLIVDPATGVMSEARWAATSNPAIQRLAR